MKKLIWLSVFVFALCAATCQSKELKPFMGTVQYDMVVKTKNATTITRVWMKKGNMKIITKGEDEDGDPIDNITIILPSKNVMYCCNASAGVALKMHIDPGTVKPPIPVGPEYKKVGTETLSGRLCDVYIHKMKEPGLTSKVWIWRKKNLPVKTISGLVTAKCININFKPIPDLEFRVPRGLEIIDMSGLK